MKWHYYLCTGFRKVIWSDDTPTVQYCHAAFRFDGNSTWQRYYGISGTWQNTDGIEIVRHKNLTLVRRGLECEKRDND